MSLWVLDTDILTLLNAGNEAVCRRVLSTDPAELAVTIITVEEALSGWYAQIRRARTDEQLALRYEALRQAVKGFGKLDVLPFSGGAAARFRQLRQRHRRTGTNDLRIASIVLEHSGILVTRNLSDFGNISGLETEDWSS